MKKIIALVLSIVIVCCFSVTAFAAESPVATEKITVIVRKGNTTSSSIKVDVEYTLDEDDTVTVTADEEEYGEFNNWSIYKVVEGKTVAAVEGVDYEIVKGSANSKEFTIKLKTAVIICANYNDVVTDPLKDSTVDDSDKAPTTGDMTAAYIAVVMLAVAVFGFGVKKVYSK